jgi:DNA-binding NarL/FixJ family response regulator
MARHVAGNSLFRMSTAAVHNARGHRVCDDQHVRPTILIVDDHAAFRESAGALLEAEGFDVIGEAADGDDAVAQARLLRPHIVLLDIQLPGPDGFAVAERLASEPEPPAVVLISSREAAAYGERLKSAEARGFIAKGDLSGAALAAVMS